MGWRPSCVHIFYKFHDSTPKGGGGNFGGVKSVKLLYFVKKSSSLLPGIDQTYQYVEMMTNEGSTKIVNCMTPGVGVLVQERGHICHIVTLKIFFSTPSHRSDKPSM